jgi:hypothetical protein
MKQNIIHHHFGVDLYSRTSAFTFVRQCIGRCSMELQLIWEF